MLTLQQMEEVRGRLAQQLIFYMPVKLFPIAQKLAFPILLEFTRLVDFRNLEIPPEKIKITDLIYEDRLPSVFESFIARRFSEGNKQAELRVAGIITPDHKIVLADRKTAEGFLIKANSAVWYEIVASLQSDWSQAYSLSATRWEEIVAGAFDKAGFDEVTLTPRSGDHGRDVIAVRRGLVASRS
ncbi:restriction endonuclease [Bradyrhizobium diazoefficiens]|uniref:restriction endonuclease n=1 Tax=Bradyrhizobium diazoefficiens TaxID=1355477 RepID=UPI0034924ED7